LPINVPYIEISWLLFFFVGLKLTYGLYIVNMPRYINFITDKRTGNYSGGITE